jgi:protein N-lysine methyltransferase METTL21A
MEDRPSPASSTPSENDVFGIDETIVPAQVRKTAGNTAISLDGLLDPPLLLYEDVQDGCGGQLWPAGMVLSRYMLTCHKDDLADKAM